MFSTSGARVWRLTRTPTNSKCHFDWNHLKNVGLPPQTQIVVNACGQNILDKRRRWSESLRRELFESRIESTRLLCRSLIEMNPPATFDPLFPVYVGLSGVAVYSDQTLTPHDESSTVLADHLWAQMCLQLEQTALCLLNEPTKPAARCLLMRTGVVLGKSGGIVRDLWLPFKLGLGARIGSGRQPLPWIHLHDLVELIMYLTERPDADGVFNAVAPTTATNAEFTRALAAALHRPAPFFLPKCMMRVMFGRERARLVLRSPHVIPARAEQFGFTYMYPTLTAACEQLAS